MINILDGTVTDNQEIKYEKNKESALKALSLHKFVPGEMFIVGYDTERSTEDNKTTVNFNLIRKSPTATSSIFLLNL